MNHELKIPSRYFRLVLDGRKPFEIRKNDRDFTEGDTITLKEIDESGAFTCRTYSAKVGYVTSLKNVMGDFTGFETLDDCAVFYLLKEDK